MTLFFNLDGLLKLSKGNPNEAVRLLKTFKNKGILKPGQRDKLIGHSWLLNPDALLNDKITDILYIYQYLQLAGRRDYTHYKLFGVKSLPLSYFPDINLSSIRTNPLLEVTNSEIKFKHEE